MAVCECDGGRNLVDGGVSWLFALEGCAVEITQFCAATSQITQLSSVRGMDKANQRDSNPHCLEEITQLCAVLLKTIAETTHQIAQFPCHAPLCRQCK